MGFLFGFLFVMITWGVIAFYTLHPTYFWKLVKVEKINQRDRSDEIWTVRGITSFQLRKDPTDNSIWCFYPSGRSCNYATEQWIKQTKKTLKWEEMDKKNEQVSSTQRTVYFV